MRAILSYFYSSFYSIFIRSLALISFYYSKISFLSNISCAIIRNM